MGLQLVDHQLLSFCRQQQLSWRDLATSTLSRVADIRRNARPASLGRGRLSSESVAAFAMNTYSVADEDRVQRDVYVVVATADLLLLQEAAFGEGVEVLGGSYS